MTKMVTELTPQVSTYDCNIGINMSACSELPR